MDIYAHLRRIRDDHEDLVALRWRYQRAAAVARVDLDTAEREIRSINARLDLLTRRLRQTI